MTLSAIGINSKFIKGLDRRARVLQQLGRQEDALIDAVAAAVLDQFKNELLLAHIEDLLRSVSEEKAKLAYKVISKDSKSMCCRIASILYHPNG